jgi:hypothetical protein
MSTLFHPHAQRVAVVSAVRRSAVGTRAPWLLLSVPLALLAIAGSIAGLVVDSVTVKETDNWAAQVTGQDVANLVVFPAMLAAAWLAWRGSLRAFLVWSGLVAASAYTYAIYAFDVHWGRLFLLDVAVLGLSLWSLVGGLTALDANQVKRRFDTASPTRAAGILLLVVGAGFMLLWLSIELPAAVSGTPPDELADNGLVTNPVHVLDLALFLPAAIVAGVLLLRRQALGYALAPLVLTAMVAISIGIASLTIVAAERGLDWSAPVAVLGVVLAVVEAVVLARFLRALREERSLS